MNTSQDTFKSFSTPVIKPKTTDVSATLLKYLYHWPLFFVSMSLSAIGFWIYLKVATPVYEAKASLLIQNERKTSGERSALQEIDLVKSARIIENELEILKSKQIFDQVIKDLHLGIVYHQINGLVTKDLYNESPVRLVFLNIINVNENPIINLVIKDENSFYIEMPNGELKEFLYKDTFKNKLGIWKLEKTKNLKQYGNKKISITISDPEKLAIQYQKRIGVNLLNKQSTAVALTISDVNAQRGKDILNRLIFNYILAGAKVKSEETSSTLDFIDQRLDSLANELNKAERRIETFKSSRGLTDISSDSKMTLENMQVNDGKLNEVSLKLNVIEGIEQYINSSENSGKLPSTLGIEDPALNSFLEKLNQLQLQREKLLATTPETNPDFEPIDRQIALTKETISENVRNVQSSLRNTRDRLQALSNQFESSIRAVPLQERQFINIKRQQAIKESLYTYLLQKREEVSVSYANTIVDNRILDEAYVGPVKGTTKSIALVTAIFMGFGFPLGLIFLRDLLSSKVTDIQDIRDVLDIPIIGELPFSKSTNPVAVNGNGISTIGEQFRTMRIKLHRLIGEREQGRVVLLTSSVSGEGKSFVSSNLAVAMAISGRKTIILELDLRKPKIARSFNLQNAQLGISEFLQGRAKEEDIIQSSGVETNLDFIGSGARAKNPSELLERKQLTDFIKDLRAVYEYIIIDSPPVHLVPDAMVLSESADITLYVVRQGLTNKAELNFVKELYNQKQLPDLNIVFNGIQKAKYGYGYDYDLAYYNNNRPNVMKSLFSDFSGRF